MILAMEDDVLRVDLGGFVKDSWPGMIRRRLFGLDADESLIGIRYTGPTPTGLLVQLYLDGADMQGALNGKGEVFAVPMPPETFLQPQDTWCPLAQLRPHVLAIVHHEDNASGGLLHFLVSKGRGTMTSAGTETA